MMERWQSRDGFHTLGAARCEHYIERVVRVVIVSEPFTWAVESAITNSTLLGCWHSAYSLQGVAAEGVAAIPRP